MAAIDPRESGSGRFPNAVLRALLYCHGLVLEDPLALAADVAAGSAGETRAVARRVVAAAAASLAGIAPLIDAFVRTFFFPPAARQRLAGTIDLHAEGMTAPAEEIWNAFESAFVDGLGPELGELWARVRAGDRSPPLGLVKAAAGNGDPEVVAVFIEVLRDLRPSAVIDNALGIIGEALNDLHLLDGSSDLLCPNPGLSVSGSR